MNTACGNHLSQIQAVAWNQLNLQLPTVDLQSDKLKPAGHGAVAFWCVYMSPAEDKRMYRQIYARHVQGMEYMSFEVVINTQTAIFLQGSRGDTRTTQLHFAAASQEALVFFFPLLG